MSDLKQYNDKRFLIDYSAAIDDSYCVLWAIPIGLAKVMIGLLSERGLWRSTYVKEYHKDYYIAPTFEEFEVLTDAIGAFLGELSMANCLDGLLTVLGEIRDAIRSQAQCCLQGSNPYEMIDIGEGNYAFGTELPLTEPPEGEFESEEAYRQNRCDAANIIVSDLVSAFNQFGIVTLASIVAGGIAVAAIALITVPPVGIFYALALAGFLFGACELISNYIEDHRQELVCMLYSAETYADWEIAYADWVETLAIELEIAGFTVDLTNLFRSMVSTDAYNKMFTTLGFPVPDEAVSCEGCGAWEPNVTMDWGAYDPETGIMTSEQQGGLWYIQGWIDPSTIAQWSNPTGWTNTQYDDWLVFSQVNYTGVLYQAATVPPPDSYNVGSFQFTSATEWSIEVTLSEP